LACCALKQLYLAEPARFFQSILTAYPFNRGFKEAYKPFDPVSRPYTLMEKG